MSTNKTAVERLKELTTIHYKRNSSEFFESSDYVPNDNEILVAEDTGVCKLGDGQHTWKELPAIESENAENNE